MKIRHPCRCTRISERHIFTSRRGGFALVIALIMMALCLLVMVSLSIFITVEIRTASQTMLATKARQNALMAAYIAVGELQRTLGPDARVSARADITSASLPADQQTWTGIWVSNESRDMDWNSYNDEGGLSFLPGTGHGNFITWLVSGNEGAYGNPDKNPVDSSGDSVLILDLQGQGDVRAPKVKIEKGAYAYWISDENTKALAAKADDYREVQHDASNLTIKYDKYSSTRAGENFADNVFREREMLSQLMLQRAAWEILLRDNPSFSQDKLAEIAPDGVFNTAALQEKIASAYRLQGLGSGPIELLFPTNIQDSDRLELERIFAHDLSLNSASVLTNVPEQALRVDYGDINRYPGEEGHKHLGSLEGSRGIGSFHWAQKHRYGKFGAFFPRDKADLDFATSDDDIAAPLAPVPDQLRQVSLYGKHHAIAMVEYGLRMGVKIMPEGGKHWLALPFDAWAQLWNYKSSYMLPENETTCFDVAGLPVLRVTGQVQLADDSWADLSFLVPDDRAALHDGSRTENSERVALIALDDYFFEYPSPTIPSRVQSVRAHFFIPHQALAPGEIALARSKPLKNPLRRGIRGDAALTQSDNSRILQRLGFMSLEESGISITDYLTDFEVVLPAGLSWNDASGNPRNLRLTVKVEPANQQGGLEGLDDSAINTLNMSRYDLGGSAYTGYNPDVMTFQIYLGRPNRNQPGQKRSQIFNTLVPRGEFLLYEFTDTAPYYAGGGIPEMTLGWGVTSKDDYATYVEHPPSLLVWHTHENGEVDVYGQNQTIPVPGVEALSDINSLLSIRTSFSTRPLFNALKTPDTSPTSGGKEWIVTSNGVTGGAGPILNDINILTAINIADLRHTDGVQPDLGSPDGSDFANGITDRAFVSTLPRGIGANLFDPVQAQISSQTFPNTYIELYADDDNPFPSTSVPADGQESTGLFDGRLSAGNILQRGGFNINSTSVNAWKVMLAGTVIWDDPETPGTNEGWHFSGTKPGENAFFSGGVNTTPAGSVNITNAHFTLPHSAHMTQVFLTESDLESLPIEEKMRAAYRQGVRQLTDEQVDQLASGVVAALQSRGIPFTSVREFLQSRIVENAIAATDINAGFPADSAGELSQKALMHGIMPLLTPRSDTFVIRAYGEVTPAGNVVAASARCEVVVQRVPSPVVPQADITKLDPDKNPFGRKFRIVSFRWL